MRQGKTWYSSGIYTWTFSLPYLY